MATPENQESALIVIDVQQGLVDRMGFGTDYVKRVGKAIEAARAASVAVIYVRMAFREGAPEVGPRNRMLHGFAQSGMMALGAPTSQIHSLIAPGPQDIVIDRSRVSAFCGGDLEQVLRTKGIERLVLAGNATRAGVLATFFDAADRDYRLTVLRDCCTDSEAATHDFLMDKVYPLQSSVLSLEQWVRQLSE